MRVRNIVSTNRSLKNDLISVIVPVYKAEQSIAGCIDSILSQTYENLQIILIDDGSPDRSGAICDAYASKDGRITVLHTSNGGVSAARNHGIELANGRFITFVDSDDTIEPDFIAQAHQAMEDGGIDLFLSGMRMETYENGQMTDCVLYQGKEKRYTTTALFEAFNVDYPFILICGPTCKLYRTDIIKEHQVRFDLGLTLGEDTVFNCDYLQHAQEVHFSQGMHYHYIRGNEESLFSRYSPTMYDDTIKIYDKMRLLMVDRGCSEETMHRFDALYARILIGCIYHEYTFCRQSSGQSRRATIRKVAGNPYVRRCSLQGYKHYKDIVVIMLLKWRMRRVLEFLFSAHYCKGLK